jgi:hypothetical protein
MTVSWLSMWPIGGLHGMLRAAGSGDLGLHRIEGIQCREEMSLLFWVPYGCLIRVEVDVGNRWTR